MATRTTSPNRGTRKKQKKRNPFFSFLKFLYIVIVILSIIIVGLFIAYKVFIRPPDVEDQVTFPVTSPEPDDTAQPSAGPDASESPEPSPTPTPVVYTRREGVYTCLLLGVADMGGSDTIMLGCFDTNNKTASLISIPRDTLVRYDGKDSKLNAVYGKGGAEAMVDLISSMLGVPVDYCMTVNVKAFRNIVDTIGGVNFTVPVDMDYEDPYQDLYIHISKGYQKLDGKKAEGVMRCRSCYPNADLGRVQTQRAFLTALVKQTITVSNVTKVTELINILSKYVKTNMPLDTMVYFATSAIGMDLDTALSTATLPGEWKSPYEQTDAEAALGLVNELLPVYTEPVTADIMNIYQK